MQYPSMGRNRQYRVSIPQLNGGVNYAVPPHLIEDNQLSDVKNMWYKDGRLQTRPGVEGVDRVRVGENVTHIRSIKARDKICVFSSSETLGNWGDLLFSFFDGNGEFLHTTELAIDLLTESPTNNAFIVENHSTVKVAGGYTSGKDFEVLAYGVGSTNNPYSIFGISSDGSYQLLEEYIPTIMKSGTPTSIDVPEADGTMFEPFNLLTSKFKCEYITDGKGVLFTLPEKDIAGDFSVKYTDVDGNVHSHEVYAAGNGTVKETNSDDDWLLSLDCTAGAFKFVLKDSGADVALPLANRNNVVVTANRSSDTNKNKIFKMQFSTWFGGGSSGLTGGTRLFVAGNPDERNVIRWSALNNPLYFPENNYAYVGSGTDAVTAFGKQGELLVIFKEREIYCSYYVQGVLPTAEQLQNQDVVDIEAAQAMFPVYQLHPEIGCDCPKTICLCNNRLVWFNSNRKVYGLFTTGQYSERNVRELSYSIEAKLKKVESNIFKAVATEFEGNYLLYIGDEVYVLDYSSSGFTYYSSYSSDEKAQKVITWYYWKLFEGANEINMHGLCAPNVVDIISCGSQNVFVSEVSSHYCTFKLDLNNGYDDLYHVEMGLDGNEVHWASDIVEVTSSFRTKQFNFGHSERFKNITALYFQVNCERNKNIKLTYFRGNNEKLDDYMPTLTGAGFEETTPIHIKPNVLRVIEFGMNVESDGRMEVGSLTLNYSMLGTVR